ncbi:MAG: hypothetical protein MJ227_02100 [Bacilli bacterium]|nr:hypothetical protein [Bacilli bacterium]
MKLNKLLGIAVASCGVVASIGIAAALYVSPANPVSLNIGATFEAKDGTVAYKINGSASGTLTPKYEQIDPETSAMVKDDGLGASPDYTQIHYSFTIGATYGPTDPQQRYTMGNLKLVFSSINSNLLGNLQVYVGIDGYKAKTKQDESASYGYTQYHSLGDHEITSDTSTHTIKRDIGFYSDGSTNTVNVYCKIKSFEGLDMVTLAAGKLFDLGVTLDKPEDFNYARVTGGLIGWATNADTDIYRMNPNLEATSFEWWFDNLPGEMGASKCFKINGKDEQGKDILVWSAGDDAQLTKGHTYNVSWAGGSGDAASYQDQAQG